MQIISEEADIAPEMQEPHANPQFRFRPVTVFIIWNYAVTRPMPFKIHKT